MFKQMNKKTITQVTAIVAAIVAAILPLTVQIHASSWGTLIPLGHSCDSWTITREPTCTESGERTGYCNICREDVTEEIPALLHDLPKDYTFDAEYHQKSCTRCGASVVKELHTTDESGVCTVCKAYVSVPGDANGDGKVNSKDVITLKKYLANLDMLTNTSTVTVFAGADFNADGKIDSKDIIALKKYIANLSY